MQVANHGFIPEALDFDLFFLELASDVLGALTGHLDPKLGKETARRHHERDVEETMKWVPEQVPQISSNM